MLLSSYNDVVKFRTGRKLLTEGTKIFEIYNTSQIYGTTALKLINNFLKLFNVTIPCCNLVLCHLQMYVIHTRKTFKLTWGYFFRKNFRLIFTNGKDPTKKIRFKIFVFLDFTKNNVHFFIHNIRPFHIIPFSYDICTDDISRGEELCNPKTIFLSTTENNGDFDE